jgi:hypothetical protein
MQLTTARALHACAEPPHYSPAIMEVPSSLASALTKRP